MQSCRIICGAGYRLKARNWCACKRRSPDRRKPSKQSEKALQINLTSAASASKQCSTMSTIFWWNGLTKGLERKEHFSFSQIQSRRAVLNGTMNHTAGWACDFSLKNAATQARLLSTCGCLMKQTLTNKKRLGSLG